MPPSPRYMTSEKSHFVCVLSSAQGESWSAHSLTVQDPRCDCVLKSTKSQTNVRICMIIKSALGWPRENWGRIELWSPLFIADSSGRRPVV